MDDMPQRAPQWRGDVPETRNTTGFVADSGVAPLQASISSAAPTQLFQDAGGRLGGRESKGAHETRGFPVVRHDTDMSVSALHVPGEYPKKF